MKQDSSQARARKLCNRQVFQRPFREKAEMVFKHVHPILGYQVVDETSHIIVDRVHVGFLKSACSLLIFCPVNFGQF